MKKKIAFQLADGDGTGSLLDLLSPELLLQVFQWIGSSDMKSYIRLAISGDPRTLSIRNALSSGNTLTWPSFRA